MKSNIAIINIILITNWSFSMNNDYPQNIVSSNSAYKTKSNYHKRKLFNIEKKNYPSNETESTYQSIAPSNHTYMKPSKLSPYAAVFIPQNPSRSDLSIKKENYVSSDDYTSDESSISQDFKNTSTVLPIRPVIPTLDLTAAKLLSFQNSLSDMQKMTRLRPMQEEDNFGEEDYVTFEHIPEYLKELEEIKTTKTEMNKYITALQCSFSQVFTIYQRGKQK